MTTVTLTEFRSQASGMLTRVENGETLVILRRGRPIAEVSPPKGDVIAQPSWKKPALRLAAKGAGLAEAILEDRIGLTQSPRPDSGAHISSSANSA
jgi:antitoxin (DNA-binding transcriptional repressor) of toxin-antitoxin stability system